MEILDALNLLFCKLLFDILKVLLEGTVLQWLLFWL